MSAMIDLMPISFREADERRRRIRRWAGAWVLTLLLVGSVYSALAAGHKAQRAELRALDTQVELNWRRNKEAQRLIKETNELEATITRYDRIAWPIRVTDAVSIVGSVMPESVTLTSMTFTPRQESGRSRATKGSKDSKSRERGAKAPPPEPKVRLVVELEGVSPNDLDLARFVAALDEHSMFETVRLDHARSRSVDGVEGREFRVTSEIDLSARYRFVQADPSEEP